MDPATKRILFGDENQRLHQMHTRRLVTLDQELTDTEIKLFEARLALKDLLESNGDFQERISSNQLKVAMLALQENEESLFQRDFMNSLGAKHKATVQGWKNGFQRGDHEYVRHVNTVNSAQKKMGKVANFLLELKGYHQVVNENYAHEEFNELARDILGLIFMIKQFLILLQYDQDWIPGGHAIGALDILARDMDDLILLQGHHAPVAEEIEEEVKKCYGCGEELLPVVEYLKLRMG